MSPEQLEFPTRFDKPSAPFAPKSETSYEAAVEIEHHVSNQEAAILKQLRLHYLTGLTQEEIADRARISRQSVCARLGDKDHCGALCDQYRDGGRLVMRTERKRKTKSGRWAFVYELAMRLR